MKEVVTHTDLGALKLAKRGKVRDIYELDDVLLIVATDRISAFDIVLPNAIPHKGKVLTSLSLFWFGFTREIVASHVLPFREVHGLSAAEHALLEGRSMFVRRANPLPVECIVRGYLSGSAWQEYQRDGLVSGLELPPGLQESAKLERPIFTPSTKAQTGHDQNISYCEFQDLLGPELAMQLRRISMSVYAKASEYAEGRGIIIADTKLEFGLYQGEITLIDELLTPDSSRFWPKDSYVAGGPQPSFDKQFVRDYLEAIRWNKEPPAPELPLDVIRHTSSKYLEALRRLKGEDAPS